MGLNKLLADTAALIATFNGKKAEIDAATTKQLTDLNAWKGQFLQRAQQNLLQDSGRFFDPSAAGNETKNKEISLGAAAFHSPFATLYNGTTMTEAGKFVHNNSTNGGTAAALSAEVKSLTDKMRGAGQARSGLEFYIAELRIGDNPSMYPLETNGVNRFISFAMTAVVPRVTAMYWLRVLEGSVHFSPYTAAGSAYRDGVQAASPILTPDDNWAHVSSVSAFTGGYVQPSLYLAAGTRCLMALPAFVAGDLSGFVHTSPVLTQQY